MLTFWSPCVTISQLVCSMWQSVQHFKRFSIWAFRCNEPMIMWMSSFVFSTVRPLLCPQSLLGYSAMHSQRQSQEAGANIRMCVFIVATENEQFSQNSFEIRVSSNSPIIATNKTGRLINTPFIYCFWARYINSNLIKPFYIGLSKIPSHCQIKIIFLSFPW